MKIFGIIMLIIMIFTGFKILWWILKLLWISKALVPYYVARIIYPSGSCKNCRYYIPSGENGSCIKRKDSILKKSSLCLKWKSIQYNEVERILNKIW